MGRCVGIDLGTTYSAIAYVTELGRPEIITNREGERITPSVVQFQGDQPLVGSMAKRSAVTAPLDTVQFVKRAMGEPSWKFVTESGEQYRPEEVSALILKRLVADAEMMLGDGTVTDAVITVPAYFDDARRRATMDAGRLAGLVVRRVLNEPTAAALAYGLDDKSGGCLLVYDLGGGTFDVTVMQIQDGSFDVLATGGDPNLGGFDWDNELMTWLNAQFMAAGGPDLLDDETSEADLRERSELAKRALTSVARTNVSLGAGGKNVTVPLTREHFDDLTSGLLGRTRHHLMEVTEAAGLGFAAIDRVLLVGGSTRMPQVRSMVEQVTGKQVERSINPDEAVALGAAVQAALLDDGDGAASLAPELMPNGVPFRISDVTSQSLGVIALDAQRRPANSVIIPHNSKVPTKRSQVYSTVSDEQETIEIEVTEGDDEDLDYVRVVGSKEISLPRYPAGAPIEICFAYDIDQTVFVEVFDRTSNELLGSFDIDRVANMTDRDVDAGQQRLDGIDVG